MPVDSFPNHVERLKRDGAFEGIVTGEEKEQMQAGAGFYDEHEEAEARQGLVREMKAGPPDDMVMEPEVREAWQEVADVLNLAGDLDKAILQVYPDTVTRRHASTIHTIFQPKQDGESTEEK